MSIPTFQEMWSMYLFDSKQAIKGKDLLSEVLIRNNALRQDQDTGKYYETVEKSTNPITISAKDFMQHSTVADDTNPDQSTIKYRPGGFVNGANSSAVKNFMTES